MYFHCSMSQVPKNDVGKYDGRTCLAIVFSHVMREGLGIKGLWRIYAGLMEDLCRIYGGFMEDYGGFMETLWKIMSVSKRNVFFYFILRGVIWRAAPAKFKTGMCEMNKTFSDLKFVVCLGTLVQDGLTHMRGVTWRAVPAKFKTDV